MATTKPFRRQFKNEWLFTYVDKMRLAKNFSQIDMVKELVKSGSYNEQEAAWDYLKVAKHYTEELIALAGETSRDSHSKFVQVAAQKYFDAQPTKGVSLISE